VDEGRQRKGGNMYLNQPAPQLLTTSRRLVILPIGSCEQHGPYLPIDTDLRIAQLLAENLALQFSDALLLPALPFSCSWEHKGLGTIALTVSTVAATIHDIAYSLKTWETPNALIIVNWHGGNDVLASLAAEITAREGVPTAVIPSLTQVGKAWDTSTITTAKDIHAGAVETSVVQAYWPELIVGNIPRSAHCEPVITPAKPQAVLQSLGSHIITRDGIWGAPEDADPYKGRLLIETLQSSMYEQASRLLELVTTHQQ